MSVLISPSFFYSHLSQARQGTVRMENWPGKKVFYSNCNLHSYLLCILTRFWVLLKPVEILFWHFQTIFFCFQMYFTKKVFWHVFTWRKLIKQMYLMIVTPCLFFSNQAWRGERYVFGVGGKGQGRRLYKKGIKKTQNKPMETTLFYVCDHGHGQLASNLLSKNSELP